jgi:choline dehydrogenase
LTRAFLRAAEALGSRYNPDINGAVREGVALYQQNRKGRFRSQPAQSYLRAARRRGNVTVLTNALCTGVGFDGKQVASVGYRRGGINHTVKVRGEVILSAGTVRTPQLLQLSGIGDRKALNGMNIPIVSALGGVGRNLRDHFMVRIGQRLRGIVTLNERTRGANLLWQILRYTFAGQGLLTMGAGTAADIFRSRPESKHADALLLFAPGSYLRPGVLEDHPGMTVGCWPSHPESQGSVTVRSPDAAQPPDIRFNYLDEEVDQAIVIAGIRRARAIFAHEAFAEWSVAETKPGREVQTDDEILGFARQEGGPGYHLVGTCKMGVDSASVVDPELKVRGVAGLRVVDASVMPNCTVGNPNASIVAMAERASDLILGKTPVSARSGERPDGGHHVRRFTESQTG